MSVNRCQPQPVSINQAGYIHGEGVVMKGISELRSKLFDGLLPSVIIFLVFVVSLLLVSPIEYMTGKPGVMVYTLALVAVSVMCLERSVNSKAPESTRALNGIAGGTLAWLVVELSNYIGSFEIESVTGVLLFILVVLITTTIWRRGLPIGIQYFGGSFVLLWGGYLLIASEKIIANWLPVGSPVITIAGWAFITLAAVSAALILFKSRNRLERIWGALLIAFFMILALNTFNRPGL
jgi:hypothetical protein